MTNIQYADVTVIASQLNADGVESILLDADFAIWAKRGEENGKEFDSKVTGSLS